MSYATALAFSSKKIDEKVPEFVGSNWIPFSSAMHAYLKTQGVTRYIEHGFVWPPVWTPDLQAEYSAVGVSAERRKELREIRKDYEDAVDSDNIASSIIQLKDIIFITSSVFSR
jgi:hypothetical protein